MASRDRLVGAFNRFVVVLLALTAIVGAFGLLVDSRATVSALTALASALATTPEATLAPDAAIAIVLALVVIGVESLPSREQGYFESRVEGGIVAYTSDAVARALAAEVSTNEGIADPLVQVTERGGRAQIRVTLVDSWGSDTPVVATRVATRVRERAMSMGFALGDVRVDVGATPREAPTSPQRATVA